MGKIKTHYEDCDILVVGGGMAGTGATFEARHWGSCLLYTSDAADDMQTLLLWVIP